MNLCINCVHHEKDSIGQTTFYSCDRTVEVVVNPVLGHKERKIASCQLERGLASPSHCGPEGQFFVQNGNPVP